MEYCSPFLAGAPASHLSWLHVVETKAFEIIGISRDEAVGLSLPHRRQVGGLSVFHHHLSGLASSALSVICPAHISAGCSRSASNPLLVKLPKSRMTAHLHSFIPLFSPPLEQTPTLSSIQLFPPRLQNSCSPPSLIYPHPKP